MKFLDLEIGKHFVFIREKELSLVWTKINDNKHNNARCNNELCSVHGNTQVGVID